MRFLAAGGMGEVYEVKDRLLPGAHYALKTINSAQSANEDSQERFKKEVLLARQIIHPNVCPIYDLFYAGEPLKGHWFLTMKLLHGESLAARLDRESRLQRAEAWALVQQLAKALRAAHEAGVVHRDFKPGNIMLDGHGEQVKATVTDFGLARDVHSDATGSLQGQIWGTRGYIAPEVMNHRPANAASDLYAFGVVLHQIYTGARPDESLTKPASESDSGIKDVPKVCERLIRGCLDADPLKRCRAFESGLDHFDKKSSSGFSYVPVSTFSRRVFLGSAAAAVGITAGVVWWEREDLEPFWTHLPVKRFVALISWPPPTDSRIGPLLKGALDAVASELSRLEATDRELLIISQQDLMNFGGDASKLKLCCEAVGANLALAASGIATSSGYTISLQLLDALSSSILRQRHVNVALKELPTMTNKVVAAAAHLLGLKIETGAANAAAGTNSPDAFRKFQKARSDSLKLNDAGLDAGIDGYGKAVASDNKYVEAYGELARLYTRKFAITSDPSYLNLANANADAALRLDAGALEAHIAKAEVWEESGKAVQAVEEIRKALALDPENFKTLDAEAEIFQRFNRLTEAEATYRRVLALRPNHWLTYNRLGQLLVQQGRYQEGLKYFQLAKTLSPKTSVVLNNIGAMALKFGLVRDAEADFQSSIAVKPSAFPYYNLSQLALVQKRYPDAVRYAIRASELHGPLEDQVWLQLGDCYQQMRGKARNAADAYAKAVTVVNERLQTDKTNGTAWMLLALYSLKVNARFDPQPLTQKAESLGADDLDSQATKIRILELSNRRAEALQVLAVCFRRGLTPFEVTLVPDLDGLRRDPNYAIYENAGSPGSKL